MTVAPTTGRAKRGTRKFALPMSLRLALRDLRGGLRGFRVFIACIVLGVAAIIGIGSAASILSDSLAQEGQQLLGGDVAVRVVHNPLPADQLSWLTSRGSVTSFATMRAMARNNKNEPTLVELKAIDEKYPLIGKAVTDPAVDNLSKILDIKNTVYGIAADSALFVRLGLKIGDRISVGDGRFELRAKLLSEPDKISGGIGFGPRVFMTAKGFQASGLVQPGSLIRWNYRLLIKSENTDPKASDAQVKSVVSDARKDFPNAGWRIRTRANVSPNFSRNLDRFAQFLTLIALTALIIGGVGVANAVRGFMERKQHDMAVLKSLGASGGYIFRIMIAEVILAAGLGIALGAILGLFIPFAIAAMFAGVIPIPFTPSVYPSALVAGIAFGFLTALAFALPALGRVHDTPVSALFREQIGGQSQSLRLRYKIMFAVIVTLFLFSVLASSSDQRLALIFLGVAFAVMVVFRLIGYLIIYLAKQLPRIRNALLRLSVANIHRPGAMTQSVVLSLGLGLTLLVTLTVIDLNMRELLREGVPGKTPSFFFVDIQKNQSDAFGKFIAAEAPNAKLLRVPMMRGRVLEVKGIPAEKIKAAPNVAWVLRGDRGITYSDTLAEGSVLTEGRWWEKNYSGTPLVSVESEAGEGLGLKIGDLLTFNILGRKITARVANFRKVNWRSFGINFVFVFSASTFAGAPHTYLATATFSGTTDQLRELQLLKSIASKFPTVTTVRVRETLDAIEKVMAQLGFAIRGATLLTLIASILVLAGAVSAGQKARIYDSVVLKSLGATRRRLIGGIVLEYAILGIATGLFSLAAGVAAAWAILTLIMNLGTFDGQWLAASQAIIVGFFVTILVGLAGTWRALNEKPARHLRSI